MNVQDILRVTNGELIAGDLNDLCEEFDRDSRTVGEGQVYLAIKGDNFDGNLFVEEAVNNGAKTCIISCDVFENVKDEKILNKIRNNEVNIIKVEDTIKAIQDVASLKRSIYNIPVVAITGSVGKTSTKDIIASVMAQKYKVYKTQGNLNNHIGVPFTILSLKDEEALVIEMGMNHLGEISTLTKIAKPTLAVITNIGTAHIGNLGSRENILKAKLEILEGLQGDTVVINNDNDLLNEWAKNQNEYKVISYGIENENSTYVAKNIKSYEDKSVFELNGEEIVVPVGGEHFVLNALCAIAVGKYHDISFDRIKKGILNFELTKSRMETDKASNGATIINDCYNANYDSMKAALKYLEGIKCRRKIAVLGDMLELGDFSKELHENVGSEIKNIDILITIGNEAKFIAKNASAKEVFEYNSNVEAIEKLKEIISEGDVVLLKASNSMNFDEIVKALKQ